MQMGITYWAKTNRLRFLEMPSHEIHQSRLKWRKTMSRYLKTSTDYFLWKVYLWLFLSSISSSISNQYSCYFISINTSITMNGSNLIVTSFTAGVQTKCVSLISLWDRWYWGLCNHHCLATAQLEFSFHISSLPWSSLKAIRPWGAGTFLLKTSVTCLSCLQVQNLMMKYWI